MVCLLDMNPPTAPHAAQPWEQHPEHISVRVIVNCPPAVTATKKIGAVVLVNEQHCIKSFVGCSDF